MSIPSVIPETDKQELKKNSKKEKKEKSKDVEVQVKQVSNPQVLPVDTVATSSTAVSSNSIATSAPMFKVQILASASKLPSSSPQLKGQEGVDSYEEGGLYKFTIGASTDYNEISQLRKSVLEKFPQAFIIAFKDGKKMDVRLAIEEFKNKKAKK